MTAWSIDTDEHDYRAPADHIVSPVRVIKKGDPKMVKDDKPQKQVKVKVSDKWSVAHDGKRYVQGDTLTVPEDVADEWERSGWVERATTKSG